MKSVRNIIRHAIGPYGDLIFTVRKSRWYGHTTISPGLAKVILQGTVPGGRGKGRQKKRWKINISEWTGLGLGVALQKAEDRKNGEKWLPGYL